MAFLIKKGGFWWNKTLLEAFPIWSGSVGLFQFPYLVSKIFDLPCLKSPFSCGHLLVNQHSISRAKWKQNKTITPAQSHLKVPSVVSVGSHFDLSCGLTSISFPVATLECLNEQAAAHNESGSLELFLSQWVCGRQQCLHPDPLPSVPSQVQAQLEQIIGKDFLSAACWLPLLLWLLGMEGLPGFCWLSGY